MFGSRHGTQEGVNPITHRWVNGLAVRRTVEEARKLLAEAGYPDGRDAQTGEATGAVLRLWASRHARSQTHA